MLRSRAAGVASLALVLWSSASAGENPLYVANVTIIDGTGAAATKQARTVVVRDGRIADILDAAPEAVYEGTVVDGTGKFLIPGLWDFHVHTRYQGIDHLRLSLGNGITAIREMAGPWSNFDGLVQMRSRIDDETLLGPRIFATGHALDGERGRLPFIEVVRTEDEARAAVIAAAQRGVDHLKVLNGLPEAAYFAALDEARAQGLPVASHVPFAVSARAASDAGAWTIEHTSVGGLMLAGSSREAEIRAALLEGAGYFSLLPAIADSYDPAKGAALFRQLAANGTRVVPTVALLETELERARGAPGVLDSPRLRYVPAAYRELWEQQAAAPLEVAQADFRTSMQMLRQMIDAGVTIIAGSDTVKPWFVPGFALHDELALFVAAGMSEMRAIEAATRLPAEAYGLDDQGSIEIGHVADMVLLAGDPLRDIGNTRRIEAVILRGRLLDRKTLDEMLNDIEREARQWTGTPTGFKP